MTYFRCVLLVLGASALLFSCGEDTSSSNGEDPPSGDTDGGGIIGGDAGGLDRDTAVTADTREPPVDTSPDVVPSNEICDSGADEDLDGLVDCADLDCAMAEHCRIQAECAELAAAPPGSRAACSRADQCGDFETCLSEPNTLETICLKICSLDSCSDVCAADESCTGVYEVGEPIINAAGHAGVCTRNPSGQRGDVCVTDSCGPGLLCLGIGVDAGMCFEICDPADNSCPDFGDFSQRCVPTAPPADICIVDCDVREEDSCPAGLECSALDGNNGACFNPRGSCISTSCDALGVECGEIDDGCGTPLDCGGCRRSEACIENAYICQPRSCEDEGAQCGMIDNGCGEMIDCSACTGTDVCTDNQCVCQPTQTCDSPGIECGILADDGCGNSPDCGACGGSNDVCQPDNTCACVPDTCASLGACGSIDDGCGNPLECGACEGPNDVCTDNQCVCVPTTCQAEQITCGTLADDGCGNSIECDLCPSPQVCGGAGVPGECGCMPSRSCQSEGRTCGTLDNGCGTTLNCGSCTQAGSFCSSSGRCEDDCNPLSTGQCPSGFGCYIVENEDTTCVAAGGDREGDSCVFANDCQPTLACAGNACREICRLDGNDCPFDTQCQQVTGWNTYGVCL